MSGIAVIPPGASSIPVRLPMSFSDMDFFTSKTGKVMLLNEKRSRALDRVGEGGWFGGLFPAIRFWWLDARVQRVAAKMRRRADAFVAENHLDDPNPTVRVDACPEENCWVVRYS